MTPKRHGSAVIEYPGELTVTMVFGDKAGRDHMTKHDGQESSSGKLEDYLVSLPGKEETR